MEALGWLTVVLTFAVDEPRAPELHAIPILPPKSVEVGTSDEPRGLGASLESGNGVLTLSEVTGSGSRALKAANAASSSKDDGKPCANCEKRVMPRLTPVRMPLPKSGPPPESVPVPLPGTSRKTTTAMKPSMAADQQVEIVSDSAQSAAVSRSTQTIQTVVQQQPSNYAPRRSWFGRMFDSNAQVDAVPRYEESLRTGRQTVVSSSAASVPMQQVVVEEAPARRVPAVQRQMTTARQEVVAQREAPVQHHNALKVVRKEEPQVEVVEDHGRLGGQLFGDSDAVVKDSEPKTLSRSASAWTYTRPEKHVSNSVGSAVVAAPVQTGLEGRVQKSSINGGAWLLTVDGKSGTYVLSGDRRLSRLRAGDRVHVEGSVQAEKSNEYLGMPVYQVEKLVLMEFADADPGKIVR